MIEESKLLFERAKKMIPGGVHSPVRAFKGVGGTPLFIQSAEGSRLHDVDGNSYVDYCMSWGPLIFGHRDPETQEAITNALQKGWSYGTAEPYSIELSEFITSRIPWVDKIRFVNSGTEAVMTAIRLARGFTGRSKIIKFDGCYHGHTDSMLVRAGSGLAEMSSPDSAGVPRSAAADTLVAPLNDLSTLRKLFEENRENVAAVIIEPLPANNGLLIQKDSFLKAVAELARENHSLLIFDEVISGFRVAFGGMAERTGITPDIVTYGKTIGGGFPIGAIGGRSDILDCLAPEGAVYQAGTLSANPVAVSAGLATLKKLWRDRPYADLEQKTQSMAQAIEKRTPLKVQSVGSIFWMCKATDEIYSPTDFPPKMKEEYSPFFHSLVKDGYYLAPSAFEVGFMSTAHTSKDNEGLVEAIVRITRSG